jgi:hypothetical protein
MKQAIIFLLLVALVAPAAAIQMGISSNAGSIYTSVDSNIDDSISMDTAVSSDLILHHTSGKGNFVDKHSIEYKPGHVASIDVTILKSNHYDYSYSIDRYDGVSALAYMSLDVKDARRIWAESKAVCPSGWVESSIDVKGSLNGYSCNAFIDDAKLRTVQSFSKAKGDVTVETKGIQNGVKPHLVSRTTKSTVTDCSDYAILPLTEKSIYLNQIGQIEKDYSEKYPRQDFRASIYDKGRYARYSETNLEGSGYNFVLNSTLKETKDAKSPVWYEGNAITQIIGHVW